MALIRQSTYKPPFWLINGHFDTIYPAVFRQIELQSKPKRITIHTLDYDYFELDYYDNQSTKTVVLSHGLEGNSEKPYILGMAKIFFNAGWNVIAWNYRGCNGKINNSIKSYHSGFTVDLESVINFADIPKTTIIALIGYSLGGNLTLKYLGESKKIHKKIKSAVTLSVPLDLHLGCLEISKKSNLLYSKRFLNTLKKKVRNKAVFFPEIETKHLSKIHDLKTFDDYYTAPLHGFKDALDYYRSCSAIYVLDHIQIPTLIINAQNDPFLPESCYPYDHLRNHTCVHLETPSRGGHVGFCSTNGNEFYWSEKRALEFIESSI